MARAITTQTARWRVFGPHLRTYEDEYGTLDICHADGVDTRWNDRAMLGPEVNTLTLTASGETAADVNGIALTDTMHANTYVYAIRGDKPGKVRLDTHAVINQNTFTAFSAAPTAILKTTSAAGTEELTFFLPAAAWRVIASVGTGVDTHAANSLTAIARHGGEAFPGDIIAVLGRGTGSIENGVFAVELTGSVTMAAPVLVEKSLLASAVQFTGFALDGIYWVPMTTRGPIYFNADFLRYRLQIPELGEDQANGRNPIRWSYLGTVYPTTKGLRYQQNVYEGASIGPETRRSNQCPVRGQPDALAADDRWLYASIYNAATGDTYVCAARPRMEDDRHSEMLSWFTLYKVADSARVKAMRYVNTARGALTNPEVWHGNGSDLSYFVTGRTDRWPDDENYRYTTSGNLYLTRTRRLPWNAKRPRGFVIHTANCSATQTVTVKLSVDGRTSVEVAVIRRDGHHWVAIPETAGLEGMEFQPVITLATADATVSPQVIGEFVLVYDVLPMAMGGEYAQFLEGI